MELETTPDEGDTEPISPILVQPETAPPGLDPSVPDRPVNWKNIAIKIALALGVETIMLIAALSSLVLHYVNRPPVFTIIDNYHGPYASMECCCFIVEYEGKFTEEAWHNYVDTFRERYLICFSEVEAIVIACFDDYNEDTDTFDSAERIVTLYDLPSFLLN